MCCQGMPRDNGYGGCGCPNPLEWIDGRCQYPRATCAGSSEIGLCDKDPRQNFAQWLVTHGCFIPANTPYKATCCPYVVGGNYDDVWAFDLPDSKIQIY